MKLTGDLGYLTLAQFEASVERTAPAVLSRCLEDRCAAAGFDIVSLNAIRVHVQPGVEGAGVWQDARTQVTYLEVHSRARPGRRPGQINHRHRGASQALLDLGRQLYAGRLYQGRDGADVRQMKARAAAERRLQSVLEREQTRHGAGEVRTRTSRLD